MTDKKKLTIAFSLIIILFLAIVVITNVNLIRESKIHNNLYNHDFKETFTLLKLESNINNNSARIKEILLSSDFEERKSLAQSFEKLQNEIQKGLENIISSHKSVVLDYSQLDSIYTIFLKYAAINNKVIKGLLEKDVVDQEMLDTKLQLSSKLRNALTKLSEENEISIQETIKDSEQSAHHTIIIFIGIGLVSFILIIFIISVINGVLLKEKQASETSRNILKTSIDPLVTINKDGKITNANDAMEKATGLKRENLIHANFSTFFTEPEKIQNGLTKIFEDGFVRDLRLTLKHTSGKLMPVTYTATVYKNNKGKVVGAFAAARDITEIVQAETEMEKHQQELEQQVKSRTLELEKMMKSLKRSNEELEQFAYIASHDLQEPLRMVSSYTQLLARRYKDQLDDDASDFINFAVDGANRMQQLINDLLEYSRVTTRGKAFTKIELDNVLGMAVANLSLKIRDAHAIVTNDNLPVVLGDETQLVRVFQNLIDNAIKFKNEEDPRIHVGAKEEDGKVTVWVKDNGMGIDHKFHDRIFTIFQRLNKRGDYPGTGIGLSVCKRTIERHGGGIWFESEPNKGTTFYFTLNA